MSGATTRRSTKTGETTEMTGTERTGTGTIVTERTGTMRDPGRETTSIGMINIAMIGIAKRSTTTGSTGKTDIAMKSPRKGMKNTGKNTERKEKMSPK
jgi:hypothetical protein